MAARLAPVLVAATLLLASCTEETGVERPATPPRASAQPTPDASEDAPSALDDPANPAFPAPLIELEHLVSGGPPPDGIPPIDNPRFSRRRGGLARG